MLTKQEQLISALGSLNNAEVRVVTVTRKTPLKKSRLTKDVTPPSLVKTKKYALRDNQLIGMDYEELVKKMRFKEASLIEKVKKFFLGDEFKAQGTYTEPITDNGAVLRHKGKGTVYARTYARHDAPVLSEYYDGNDHIISSKWKELEAEYFPMKGDNKSQGLERPIRVNNTELKNMKYVENLETGEILYNDLSKRMLRKLKLLK
jgi:hypothetical protein